MLRKSLELLPTGPAFPSHRLLEGETEKLLHMEERLHQRVIGQDEAVSRVSNAVRRARAGMQDPQPPNWFFHLLRPYRCRQD